MPVQFVRLIELGAQPIMMPSSDDMVTGFEDEYIGARLPEDYREFLKTYNGVQFKTVVCYRCLETLYPGKNAMEGIVDWLYGLLGRENSRDLVYALDCFKQDMPKGCLPIGENIFGDQICIGTLGEQRGEIHFWDHDLDASDGTMANLPLIARTFDEFVNSFYVKPEHT